MPQQLELHQIDSILDRADAMMTSDYSEAIEILNGVTALLDTPPSASDPFSDGYADWVMSTYKRVANISAYEPATHEADCNVRLDLPLSAYFPYNTKDLNFIGRYMTGVGMVLSELKLPVGSHVVEYGVGWGHVAAALVRSGYLVTCVDIEPKFLELARRQAEALGCCVATQRGEFGASPFPDGRPGADGVVFHEAFHHSFKHREVLHLLRRTVLRPGGVLVLAAEPVHPAFPVPWGIRPDGHALWAVRRNKWMELGFREDYLIRALLREGFLVSRTQVEALGPFGLLYRGRLHEGRVRLCDTLLPNIEQESWAPRMEGETCGWAQMDSRATLDQSSEFRVIEITVTNRMPVPLSMAMDAGGKGPATRRRFAPGETAKMVLALPPSNRELRVWSETVCPAQVGVQDPRCLLGVAVEDITYRA